MSGRFQLWLLRKRLFLQLQSPTSADARSRTRNYVQPVTAIQSVSAETSDSSLQVQARDEEIELLHAQIECFPLNGRHKCK